MAYTSSTFKNANSKVFWIIFFSSFAISSGLPNCKEWTESIAVNKPICGFTISSKNSISIGRSIPYSKIIISYGFFKNKNLIIIWKKVFIDQKIEGLNSSISKTESDNQSSQLKFLVEV